MRLRLLACGILICFPLSAAAQPSDDHHASSPAHGTPSVALRTPVGPFVVIGSDNFLNMRLMRWAEEITQKLGRTIGEKLPSERAEFRIVVHSPSPGSSIAGRISTGREFVEKKLVQRLIIHGYESVDNESLNEALCRLLLYDHVLERGLRIRERKRQDQFSESHGAMPSPIPLWLSQGLAQNLFPSLRARNSEIVFGLREKGNLPSPIKFLRPESNPPAQKSDDSDNSVYGLFVGWILSLPNKQERLDAIFDRLAAGMPVSPEWFVDSVSDSNSLEDFDDKWTKWILRQSRIVYQPGAMPPSAINRLKSELILSPGDPGVPFGLFEEIAFHDLIAMIGPEWIPVFAKNKAAGLRLLAVGRAEEFRDVVESYCRFLEALGETRRKSRLEKLLRRAQDGLEDLESKARLEAESRANAAD